MTKLFFIVSFIFTLPLQIASVKYNYSYYGDVVHSAPGMTYAAYFNAQTLGTKLTAPEDFVIYENFLYMVDAVENKLVIIKDDFTKDGEHASFPLTQTYIDKLSLEGVTEFPDLTLKGPSGIDVKPSGIYIADTGNYRIVKLNHQFEVIDTFSEMDDPTFDTLLFEPRKITVDSTESLYVVAKYVYECIMEINSDGSFNRFTGVNPVSLTPVEIFRRSLMTEAQLAQLRLYLPTEYTSVEINDRSFIYATSKPSSDNSNAENTIQLINPKGIDTLKRRGYHPPMGDVHFMVGANNYVVTGPSLLVDIASTKDGIFTVLDQKRSRLFTYDSEGNLLYINGDVGSQSDKFAKGVAIGYLGDDLIVLDGEARTFIVYRLTDFGRAVNQAIAYHTQGEFDRAAAVWQEVVLLNTNYEIAYNGIGKYLLREGRFKEAMEYFELGHDHYYYSKAFKSYRNAVIKDNFGYIMIVVVLIGGTGIGLNIRKTYRKGGSILYED
jgi:tetratricopeptide (TPR) repeat protein